MRVNLKTVLKDYEGNDILNANMKPDGSVEKIPLTLLAALTTAVNTPAQLLTAEGTPMFNGMGQPVSEIFTAEQKARSYQLSTKMYSGDEADFTEDETKYLKERVGKIWNSPLIQNKIFELLDTQDQVTT